MNAADSRGAQDRKWSRHPAFGVLSRWLPDEELPLPSRLNSMAEHLDPSIDSRPATAGSAGIRFTACAEAAKRSALDYERGIHDTGIVPLRGADWHDAFNALSWIAFPALKRSLNALHIAHAEAATATRGALRDTVTLLDESGVLVLCADPELAVLLRERRWKRLFSGHRNDVAGNMRFLVCGHALFDKLRRPYKALTGRALIIAAPAAVLRCDIDRQRRYADTAAASMLDALSPTASRALTVPLPIAGIPGWMPGNDDEAFYDDTAVFRPAQSSIADGSSATVAHSACAPAPSSSSALP